MSQNKQQAPVGSIIFTMIVIIGACMFAKSCFTSTTPSAPAQTDKAVLDTPHGQINNTETLAIEYLVNRMYGPGYDYAYAVLIKPINPSKDDYKAYCRYIIKDLMSKSNSENVEIYILDNKKAYTLFDIFTSPNKLIKHGRFTKEENNLKDIHIIAGYMGYSSEFNYTDDSKPYQINYYEESGVSKVSKYRSSEIYKP